MDKISNKLLDIRLTLVQGLFTKKTAVNLNKKGAKKSIFFLNISDRHWEV